MKKIVLFVNDNNSKKDEIESITDKVAGYFCRLNGQKVDYLAIDSMNLRNLLKQNPESSKDYFKNSFKKFNLQDIEFKFKKIHSRKYDQLSIFSTLKIERELESDVVLDTHSDMTSFENVVYYDVIYNK